MNCILYIKDKGILLKKETFSRSLKCLTLNEYITNSKDELNNIIINIFDLSMNYSNNLIDVLIQKLNRLKLLEMLYDINNKFDTEVTIDMIKDNNSIFIQQIKYYLSDYILFSDKDRLERIIDKLVLYTKHTSSIFTDDYVNSIKTYMKSLSISEKIILMKCVKKINIYTTNKQYASSDIYWIGHPLKELYNIVFKKDPIETFLYNRICDECGIEIPKNLANYLLFVICVEKYFTTSNNINWLLEDILLHKSTSYKYDLYQNRHINLDSKIGNYTSNNLNYPIIEINNTLLTSEFIIFNSKTDKSLIHNIEIINDIYEYIRLICN